MDKLHSRIVIMLLVIISAYFILTYTVNADNQHDINCYNNNSVTQQRNDDIDFEYIRYLIECDKDFIYFLKSKGLSDKEINDIMKTCYFMDYIRYKYYQNNKNYYKTADDWKNFIFSNI